MNPPAGLSPAAGGLVVRFASSAGRHDEVID
jgi:hypothetical protein